MVQRLRVVMSQCTPLMRKMQVPIVCKEVTQVYTGDMNYNV